MTRCARRTRLAPHRPRCTNRARLLLVAGELDIVTASRLARRLANSRSIRVLDLSRVTFIDAAGLRVIVEATHADPNLAVRAPSACVRRLCMIAGLDDIGGVAAAERTPPPGTVRVTDRRRTSTSPVPTSRRSSCRPTSSGPPPASPLRHRAPQARRATRTPPIRRTRTPSERQDVHREAGGGVARAFRLTFLRVAQRPDAWTRSRSARQTRPRRVVTDGRWVRSRKNGTLMGKKKIEQDLRAAGLRKKHARKVAKAADRARAGDRAAREIVEQYSSALRASISAVVSHARPPRSRSTKKATAKKSSAKGTSTKRVPARRSTSKSTARKAPAKKAGRGGATRGRTTSRGRSTRRRGKSAR